MDDAMVEAAAYVLQSGSSGHETVVIRAIADEDRKAAVGELSTAIRQGGNDHRLFYAQRESFNSLPDSPFVYWVSGKTIRQGPL